MSASEDSVAVVVTTFNDARFLRQALASVAAQSHPPSEIIIVDDGSEESPVAIVREFPDAVLLRKENGGLSSARNAGLQKARSHFITFLDADDRLEPDALETGLACFHRDPAAVMVYGGHRRIGAGGERLSLGIFQSVGTDPYADLLQGNVIGMHATALYRRAHLMALGGFDVTLRRCEDYDLFLRMTREHHIASHPEIIAEYRWHGGNMSSDTKPMLRTALAIHDRHRQQSGHRLRAWRMGRRNWKRWYAEGQRKVWDRAESGVRDKLKNAPKRVLRRLRAVLSRWRHGPRWPPPVGSIDFGDIGTSRPVSNDFGWDRGKPIDRYYIEAFLGRHTSDIAGRVLEVGDDAYSRAYGGAGVTQQDVLHVHPGNPKATLVGDLTDAAVLPEGAFDCIVLTQTLHLVFDLPRAVARLHAALKPSGVLLLTVPGISQIDRGEWREQWCWAFTAVSLRRLFEAAFPADDVAVASHGNVFAAVAYLTGAVVEDVDRDKLEVHDPAYPVLLTMRARRR